jgi:hypothetical protein
MPTPQWHKVYTAHVAAPPGELSGLLADMPQGLHHPPWPGQRTRLLPPSMMNSAPVR